MIKSDEDLSIRKTIEDFPKFGRETFRLKELEEKFPRKTKRAIAKVLWRLQKKGLISSVIRGFYVVIPVEFRIKGVVPPIRYVREMMAFLGKRYYVGLLDAAAHHGAAHQRSQVFTVVSELPTPNCSRRKHPEWMFVGRKAIPEALLGEMRGRGGAIKVSSPELTAVDLLFYERQVGGLGRAAGVLKELIAATDFATCDKALFTSAPVSVFQRLGYLMERVIGAKAKAGALRRRLTSLGIKFYRTRLSTAAGGAGVFDARWMLTVNVKIDCEG